MKNKIKLVLKFSFTILLCWWVFTKIDILSTLDSLKNVDLFTFLFAFIIYYIGSITLNSLIVLRASYLANNLVWTLDKVNVAMRACTLFLPVYVVSALRWKVYLNIGISKTNSLMLMLLNRFHQTFTSSVGIIIGFFVLKESFELGIFLFLIILAAVIVSLSVICLALDVFSARKVFLWILDVIHLNKFPLVKNVSSKLELSQKGTPIDLLYVVLISFTSAILIVLSQFLLISLFINVEFLHLFIARSVVQIILIAPITIAGVGAREAGFVGVMSAFGYASEPVLAFSLTLLLFQLLLFVFGLGIYFREKKNLFVFTKTTASSS